MLSNRMSPSSKVIFEGIFHLYLHSSGNSRREHIIFTTEGKLILLRSPWVTGDLGSNTRKIWCSVSGQRSDWELGLRRGDHISIVSSLTSSPPLSGLTSLSKTYEQSVCWHQSLSLISYSTQLSQRGVQAKTNTLINTGEAACSWCLKPARVTKT